MQFKIALEKRPPYNPERMVGSPIILRSARWFASILFAAALLLSGYVMIHHRSRALQRISHLSLRIERRVFAASPNIAEPALTQCPVFPKDNIWNTRIDTLPVDPRSQSYIETIGSEKPLHPDFGTRYGIPYVLVPRDQKRVPMHFEYRDQSDLSKYPVPPNAPIEGGSQTDGDRHILAIDSDRCILYEIYGAQWQSDGTMKAGSGAIWDLTSNGMRPFDWTSADAAGLPIFPGLVRYDEVEKGEIDHALRFTVPHTRAEYIWPARHMASKSKDPHLLPMGARLRLRADYDISHFPKSDQIILKALKEYGMLLADNGGAMFISGAIDDRWSDSDLNLLKTVSAKDFDVIDESDLWIMPNSARADTQSSESRSH